METLGRAKAGSNKVTSGISANAVILKRVGANYKKRRYQFDGPVPSTAKPSEGLALILETAPGGMAYRDNLGKVRFDVPDVSILPGDDDYIQGTITDDHLSGASGGQVPDFGGVGEHCSRHSPGHQQRPF